LYNYHPYANEMLACEPPLEHTT